MTYDNLDLTEEDFEKTLAETILESDFYNEDKKIQGIAPINLQRFKIKKLKNPENGKQILAHTFGDNNYFILNDKTLRVENGIKLFGHELIRKELEEIYICDSVIDAMIINQELGLDTLAVFKSVEEVYNSYNLIDNKKIFFVSSTDMFKEVKEKMQLSTAKFINLEWTVYEHYKSREFKDITLVNDYLWGSKNPSDIITSNLDLISNGSLISQRSVGLSSGVRNLDKQTQGFSCDMIGIGAGTGCGKTTFMMQLAANLIKQGQKVGLMFFEQADELETLNNLVGHFDNINYNYLLGASELDMDFDYEFTEIADLEPVETEETIVLNEDQKSMLIEKYLRPSVKKIKDQVEIMTNDNEVNCVEDALRMVRSLVIQKGCQSIFLDHTTYLTDGVENQNHASQVLMQGLMQIKNRHRINIFYVTHLRKSKTGGTHEEGARISLDDFAGGKSATQYSTVNIALERDMFNEDESLAEITKMRLLKRRGMSINPNSVTEMKFNLETNKLYPANCEKPKFGYD